jgi:predicted ArsR family transcriptional regulator
VPTTAHRNALASERRPATLEEARALSHPIRLRILRLCLHDELTNKELAGRLGLHPATVLHHVRTLVATGFLSEGVPRPGPRGTVEKPYRSTGKSWRLDVSDTGEEANLRRAVHNAVAAELDETGPGDVLESSRLAMRVRADQLHALHARIEELIDEYALVDEPDGEPVAMYVVLHRRPS